MFLHEIARPYTQINQKPVFTSHFDIFRHRAASGFHFFSFLCSTGKRASIKTAIFIIPVYTSINSIREKILTQRVRTLSMKDIRFS